MDNTPENEQGAIQENLSICIFGPEHDIYNEAWSEVLENAKIKINDVIYTLSQFEGDLWAVPPGYEWSEL
jgi:hypothetical protein